MSNIHSEYGKEIRSFRFDGSYPKQDVILIEGTFIAHEKGLLIKGLPPAEPIYTKWHDMRFITYHEGETAKVIIELEDGEIVAECKNKSKEINEFYDLVSRQKEKYNHYDSLKQVKVDLEDISIVMDTDRWENQAYLDTLTGEIMYVPTELNEDNIYDDEYVSSLPEWEKEMVEEIKEIYEDEEDRYIIIPERTSNDAYEVMVEFAKRLDNFDVSEELFDALDGRGAFRRFKDTLRRYPDIEKEWYDFQLATEKQEVREWLWSIGIEPVE